MTATHAPELGTEEGQGASGDALSDYDYELPEERIALRPAAPRDAAKLLVAPAEGPLLDARVSALGQHLRPGDRLVLNDSRVIAARLAGTRVREPSGGGPGRAGIELTLLSEAGGVWRAFARPARRLAPGDRLDFATVEGVVLAREGPLVTLRFGGDPLAAGTMPLPPYIAARRAADTRDRADYQTVYAASDGSVAAPTAGLHFTEALLGALEAKGIAASRVTLHVGPGTFLPVQSQTIGDHAMHEEWCSLSPATVREIEATRQAGGRIVAIGTTAVRVLESAAESGTLKPFEGPTAIFIRPGFRFRVTDLLMTNFHLPRSTLLMLVAAFVGLARTRQIYQHALANGYRFYSYGDASLLQRADR